MNKSEQNASKEEVKRSKEKKCGQERQYKSIVEVLNLAQQGMGLGEGGRVSGEGIH